MINVLNHDCLHFYQRNYLDKKVQAVVVIFIFMSLLYLLCYGDTGHSLTLLEAPELTELGI